MPVVSELRDPTREVLAHLVTALVERHGGPTKVGRTVGADRSTVHRWMNGDIGIDKLGLLAERLGEQVVVRFGAEQKAAPDIPERLEAVTSRLENVASGLDVWEAGRKAADEVAREPDEQPHDVDATDPASPAHEPG